MGKRSDFKRRANDLYQTPEKAVLSLLPFLKPGTKFVEPCVGDGDLVRHLEKYGHTCVWQSDKEMDATGSFYDCGQDMIITNPPWTRELMHPMIQNFCTQSPTWLLFDADWMHTKQAIPYLEWCQIIISVGRLKWVPDSPHYGKDNCAWYKFVRSNNGPPKFYGRSR